MDQEKFNSFISSQWGKTIAFLQKHFSLKQEDSEDVVQEAFIILHEHATEGKLDNLSCSLSTYFIGICRNKALEQLRKNGKTVNIIDEFPDTFKDEYEDDKIESILALEDDTEDIAKQKENLVRDIVKNLPHPCEEILWGFYRDGFSMKVLADMLNYKGENVAKVTKHRCCEKFRIRYEQLVNQLYD